MAMERRITLWRTLKHTVRPLLMGLVAGSVVLSGCSSREVVVNADSTEEASQESQEMLDIQKEMFEAQAKQINEENRQQQ